MFYIDVTQPKAWKKLDRCNKGIGDSPNKVMVGI